MSTNQKISYSIHHKEKLIILISTLTKQKDFVNSFNFLGITIDEHLNWNERIDKIFKKISRTQAVMSKIKNFLPSQDR